ncbi:hypothetical protein [Pseudomonas cichorii]|uniref:hypothetical protein n=1 Tax=Pseudomonas cichorii TaxID=36746 RepID=UPI000F00E738|nr:hypothetical protein [Pseudomonas cichorii]
MKKANGHLQARDALLTLALGISAAFLFVATTPVSATGILETRSDSDKTQMSASEKSKLRSSIKKGITQLAKLNSTLQDSCRIIMTEPVSPAAIESEPFTQVANTLRDLEAAMAPKWAEFTDMPIIGDEVLALRKALATARSRAAQNSMLLKQMGHPVETIETETDVSGIGGLATMTSGRLLQLVS